MQLTQAQREQFERDGYLFFPARFSAEEVKVLAEEVPRLYAMRRAENVREKGSDAVRTNFAAHMYSAPFARLARHPRMVRPVERLFGEPLYMHQFKINGKAAFDGDVWQWHQDFGTWVNDDLMPAPRAMNVAIFLDEVSEFNGPLMFIPGSHKLGVIEAGHDVSTTSYPLWTIDHQTIRRLVERAGGRNGGIVAPQGPAGSMIMFHSCLVHASSSNLSPWDRVSVYLSLCAVSNHIRRFKRPEWIAHRDFTPIDCLPDDCLLREYPVDLPWRWNAGFGCCERRPSRCAAAMTTAGALAGSTAGAARARVGHRLLARYGDRRLLDLRRWSTSWSRAAGFEVIAAGQGTKYLPQYHASTPETVGLTTASASRAERAPAA